MSSVKCQPFCLGINASYQVYQSFLTIEWECRSCLFIICSYHIAFLSPVCIIVFFITCLYHIVFFYHLFVSHCVLLSSIEITQLFLITPLYHTACVICHQFHQWQVQTSFTIQVIYIYIHYEKQACIFYHCKCLQTWTINTLGPRQNVCHFPDEKCIFFNEDV